MSMKILSGSGVAAVLVVCAVFACGCGRGSAGSPKSVLEQNVRMMEEFGADMEKARNASEVAAALNRYTRKMEELTPKINALKKTHPELGRVGMGGKLPAEYKEFEARFAESGTKMMNAMVRAMEYEDNTEVRKAMEAMMLAAQKMQ